MTPAPGLPAHARAMSTYPTARVAAGVPTGGQFAADHHGESDLPLDAALTGRVTVSETNAGMDPKDRGRQVQVLLKDTSRRLGRRYGVDPEELAADAALSYYEMLANGGAPANHAGYMVKSTETAAKQTMARSHGSRNSANLGAIGGYRAACAKEVARLGRVLTAPEEDVVATQVVAGYPKRRRPTIGFHRHVTVTAYDPAVHDRLVEMTVEDPGFTRGSIADRAADHLELVGGRTGVVAARAMAWDAFAERAEGAVPMVAPGSVPLKVKTAHRKTIVDAGGALAVATRFADGIDVSPEQERALFAPFGALSEQDKYEVAEFITGSPQ